MNKKVLAFCFALLVVARPAYARIYKMACNGDGGVIYGAVSSDSKGNIFNRYEVTMVFTKKINIDNGCEYYFILHSFGTGELFAKHAILEVNDKVFQLHKKMTHQSEFTVDADEGTAVTYEIPEEIVKTLAVDGNNVKLTIGRFKKTPYEFQIKGKLLKEYQKIFTLSFVDFINPKATKL